jgi:hypothetical protein
MGTTGLPGGFANERERVGTCRRSLAALVETLGGRFSAEMGIDLDRGGRKVEGWLLAATLFGTRISAAIAARTYLAMAGRSALSVRPDQAAAAFFTALLGADALSLSDESVALTTGLATAVYAGVLWWRRPRPLQQLACLAGVLATVGSAIAVIGWEETAVGLGIWAVGLGWVLLGWRALLPPTAVALLAGAAVMLLGAQAVAGGWEAAGLLLGLGSTAALLAVGTTGRRLALAGVGIVGVVMFLPATVVHFFPGTVGVPVLILLTGAALLAVTLVMLRVHPSWSHGTGSSRSDSTAGSHPA